MYEVMVRLGENRNTPMAGPLRFTTREERETYVNGPDSIVYWYFFVEEDDWTSWKRGGAWARTEQPGPADRQNIPPEITKDDRRW